MSGVPTVPDRVKSLESDDYVPGPRTTEVETTEVSVYGDGDGNGPLSMTYRNR